MSDAVKLKDAIKLYREQHKQLDDRLKQIEERNRQARQALREQSSRRS